MPSPSIQWQMGMGIIVWNLKCQQMCKIVLNLPLRKKSSKSKCQCSTHTQEEEEEKRDFDLMPWQIITILTTLLQGALCGK